MVPLIISFVIAEILLHCFDDPVRDVTFEVADQNQIAWLESAYIGVVAKFAYVLVECMWNPACAGFTIKVDWVKVALRHDSPCHSAAIEKSLVVGPHGNTLNRIAIAREAHACTTR